MKAFTKKKSYNSVIFTAGLHFSQEQQIKSYCYSITYVHTRDCDWMVLISLLSDLVIYSPMETEYTVQRTGN